MLTDISSLNELLINMPDGLDKIGKARYLYLELGKRSYFNTLYKYMSDYEQIELFNSSSSFRVPNIIICSSLTDQYKYLLEHVGINARVRKTNIDPFFHTYHPVLYFEDDSGTEHSTDLVYDLSRIQTHSKTAYFASDTIQEDNLEAIDRKIEYIENGKDYTNNYWDILKKRLEKSELSPSDKLDVLLKFSKKIVDFSLLGPNEQAQTYSFLINRILSSNEIKLHRSLNKEKKQEEYFITCPVQNTNLRNNTYPSTRYFLYDYDTKDYVLSNRKTLEESGILNDNNDIVRT